MNSQFVKDLYRLADQLEQDGQAVGAEVARNGGKRMERLESALLESFLSMGEDSDS